MLWPVAASAQDGERILYFESRIEVHADATMTVTETITVVSAGQQIERGIYRDFPTSYEDSRGNKMRVGFDVVEVRRDGQDEPFRTEKRSKGVRVYIGDPDVFIPHGEHRYTIVYKTDGQLGFFEAFDELYWNVTGNDWAFPIDRARAFVTLPEGAMVLNWAGYTGPRGAQGEDFEQIEPTGGADFGLGTTRRLRPGEGLTIAVAWPKLIVEQPAQTDDGDNLFRRAEGGTLYGGIVFALLVYFLATWWLIGRDPAKGTIIPLYGPPDGLTPATARYLMRMEFDTQVFTAAILSLAVKGWVKIRRDAGKTYILEKRAKGAPLSRGERKVLGHLFGISNSEIVLTQDNREVLVGAKKALRGSLRTDFEKTYFRTNQKAFVPGLVATGLVALMAGFSSQHPMVALFTAVWLCFWSVGCYYLFCAALRGWREIFTEVRDRSIGHTLLATFFSLPFFSAEAAVFFAYADAASPEGALALFSLIVLNTLFYHLLKAPTRLGRRMMDQIEGFQLYLSVAERDRMNLLNPPERTPELFEKFLPFALALDVTQAWGEQFAGAVSAAGQSGYGPTWYSGGRLGGRRFNDLTAELSDGFASAVSSASSSGSSGGGSSGGGGGGGGGGGW